jgi:hypothetical protein
MKISGSAPVPKKYPRREMKSSTPYQLRLPHDAVTRFVFLILLIAVAPLSGCATGQVKLTGGAAADALPSSLSDFSSIFAYNPALAGNLIVFS